MSAKDTDWLDAGLICCGLTRGITFSVRHIRKMSAVKNRIIMTGDQLKAQFWISCTTELCATVSCTGSARAGATGTCACAFCCASKACASRVGGAWNTLRTAPVTTAFTRSSTSTILGIYQVCALADDLANRASQPSTRTASSAKNSVANARSRTSIRSSAPWISGAVCSSDWWRWGKKP